MKLLIMTGGRLDEEYIRSYMKDQKYDRIIAADSGLSHCKKLGIIPTDILGDFDSLKERELLEEYQEKGVPVRTFPARKDFTDTHLAVKYALDLLEDKSANEEDEVVIVAGTGSRLDHTMANIGLLSAFVKEKVKASMIDYHNTITMLKGPCQAVFYQREDRPFLSMIACEGDVKGINMRGFSYPLEDAVLPMYDSLCISNEITQEMAIIEIREGTVIVIEARD